MSDPSPSSDSNAKSSSPANRVRVWGSWIVILVSFIVITRALPISPAVDALKDWVESAGIWGPIAFTAVYVVASVLLIPASLLTLAAGTVFGLGIGLVTVSVASTTGAAVAFLISRYLARSKVEAKMKGSKKFKAIDAAVREGGWKIVAMLRLSPAVPFTLQNYLLGVTGVAFVPYVVASWAAMLPGTLLYVYLGAAGGKAAAGGGTSAAQWVLLAVGLAVTIVLSIYLTKLAQKKLKEQTDLAADEEDEADSESKPAAKSSKWKLPIVALVFALVAGAAMAGKSTLAGLFGPPAVTQEETNPPKPDGPSFDHSAFNGLLADHVDAAGLVDYPGLAKRVDELDAYLKTLAEVPFPALGRDEKLALLINAYNAFTLRLMVDHPGIDSITSIPAEKQWDDVRWDIGGTKYSLKQIENEQIRPNFIEPRIHWAVVCAAIGCPPLRNEAYTAEKLESQLDAQTRRVLTRGTRWYQVESEGASAGTTLLVTPIFEWYGGDFKQTDGDVAKYIATYDDAVASLIANGETPVVSSLEYDWQLNSQANAELAAGAAKAARAEENPKEKSNE